MLHKNIVEQKSGFRTLSDIELDNVSGGTIVVTAPRPTNVTGVFFGSPGLLNYRSPVHASSWLVYGSDFVQNTIAESQETAIESLEEEPAIDPQDVKTGADALISGLQDIEKKHGPFDVVLQDGTRVPVATLLDGLGKISTAADAGLLAIDALNGDADVGAVAGFLVGLGVTTALAAAGAPALGTFVAGLVATEAAKFAVNSFLDFADTRLAEISAELAQQSQAANPNMTPGAALIEYLLDKLNPAPDFFDEPLSQAPTSSPTSVASYVNPTGSNLNLY